MASSSIEYLDCASTDNNDDATPPSSKRKRTVSTKIAEHLSTPKRGKKVIGATSHRDDARDKISPQPAASIFANENKTKLRSDETTTTNTKKQDTDNNKLQESSNSDKGDASSLEDRVEKCATRSGARPFHDSDETSGDELNSDNEDSIDKFAHGIPHTSPKKGGGMQIIDNSGKVISQFDEDKSSGSSSSSSGSSSDSESEVEGVGSDNKDKKPLATIFKKKKKLADKVMGKLNKAARFVKLHPSTELSNKTIRKKGKIK